MIDFTIKKKFGQKNIYIKIDKKGNVIISGGILLTKSYAKKIIEQKREWIENKISDMKHIEYHKMLKNTFFILGEEKKIITTINSSYKKTIFKFENQTLNIFSPSKLTNDELIFYRDEYYRETVKQIIPSLVERYSNDMKLFPNKTTFRKAKTRWGSCTSHNNLSFSVYLAALPIQLIENVVVHELAHIKHKNHSKLFWDLVEQFRPNLIEEKKKLKASSNLI